MWSLSLPWTPHTPCPCRKQCLFLGSTHWKQGPSLQCPHGGRVGQGLARRGCVQLTISRSAGATDPVTAPSCNQNICWPVSWLCPWRPDGWNIRVRRVTNVMAGGIPHSLQEQRSQRQVAASLQLHPDMSNAEDPAEKPRQSEATVRKE